MFTLSTIGMSPLLRLSRKLVAVLFVASYLFAGALHSVCDIDVTDPWGTETVLSVAKDKGPADKAIGAVHHCHGCFSMAMPLHVAAAGDIALARGPASAARPAPAGCAPGLELPPPKILT